MVYQSKSVISIPAMLRLVHKLGVFKHFLGGADNFQVNAVYLCTSRTALQRRRRNEANPGLDKRLNLFKEHDDTNIVGDIADSIDGDNLEDDFVSFKERNVHVKYDRQTERERDILKRHIVKQKYFKTEKHPNFLTWAEKEQIRKLHSSDALEWSTEKLSQSFPAPETVIKKIIKSHWAQEDLKKILRHDKSVQRNWKELVRGTLEIDTQLKTHLMKFAKRNQAGFSHTFLKNTNYCENVVSLVENVEGEFSKLVKSCRGETGVPKQLTISAFSGQHVDKTNNERSAGSYSRDSDTFLLDFNPGGVQNTTKLVTLSQYKQAFSLDGMDIEENFESPNDNMLQVSHEKHEKTLQIPNENSDKRPINFKPSKESKLVTGAEKSSVYLQYPERITIPKNKWKEGGTYKSGDCYYDNDGEFLYRVPGMK